MTSPIDPVPAASAWPWIWFEPHQDDALLWAGQIAAHHGLVGRELHIVSASDGSASKVHGELNGEQASSWWPGSWHYPAPGHEGYGPLTLSEFVAARDREMINAYAQLGVTQENIHLELDTRGMTLTVPQATALIRRYADQHPTAGLYTTHWTDPDPEHAALGTALRQLALAEPDKFKDCRWVIRRSQIGTVAGSTEYVVPPAYRAQALRMTKCAAKAFAAWSPPYTYAIGPHSVSADFAAVEAGQANWIVRNP